MSTTDDTRQRSVAEIIGQPGQWLNCEWVEHGKPYTVDDMLAWLRARDWDAYAYFGYDTEGMVRLTVTHPTGAMDDYDHPTLLAALEAAVRAVAEASDG